MNAALRLALVSASLMRLSCSQNVVRGLDGVLFNDLMQNVAWLFSIYDSDCDGYLTKDEILQVSEALLVRPPLPRLPRTDFSAQH